VDLNHEIYAVFSSGLADRPKSWCHKCNLIGYLLYV